MFESGPEEVFTDKVGCIIDFGLKSEKLPKNFIKEVRNVTMLFPEAKCEEKKQKILSSPVFKQELEELERKRQSYLETPIPALPFSYYRRFYEDGDRRNYEDLYFERRGRLAYLAMAVLLYHRPEDIQALENAIWAVCDEFTWVLPAHTSDKGDHFDMEVIDLFSAETGFALSEIHYLLHDELDPKINRRIRDCLEERIFQMYLNHNYWWENAAMNWAAVCAGSVGAAFMYMAPERFPLVKDRLINTMKRFLEGYGDDGACLEGIGYWNYGFSFFTYFAQLLLEFTYGAENLFSLPICSKTAAFQEHAYLRLNHTISFSDGFKNDCFFPGLTHKLHELYGTSILPMEYAAFTEHCHRFPTYLRNFFWVDSDVQPSSLSPQAEIYFPSAKWYICTQGALTLAAKAGHNDEPHNHNDIGSFILLCDDGQILCDFGCGEYDRDYFRPQTRYTYLCNSSLGHSVPIINGTEQLPGKEYCGEVKAYGNGLFALDMAGAYKVEGLHSAERKLVLDDKGFVLNDSFDFEKTGKYTVKERFVTMISPKWDGQHLIIGNYELISDSAALPVISSREIINHEAGKDTLYLIDYDLDECRTFELKVIPL